jgi:hypothetical protein
MMKYFIIALLLSANFAYAADDIEKVLEKANLSIPYYGDMFYGEPKAQIFKISKDSSWLIHQARYGGDGEHTENILMIFELYDHPSERIMKRSNNINKILQYSISNVKFSFSGEYLSKINGEVIETLCDVCDGWEASSSEDIFRIPIEINIPSLIIRSTLSSSETKELLIKLDKQADANIKEQLGYGDKTYPDYVKEIVDRINSLLISYNKANSADVKSRAADWHR